jgi:hypothetical protein
MTFYYKKSPPGQTIGLSLEAKVDFQNVEFKIKP